jgi:hypothetical protein
MTSFLSYKSGRFDGKSTEPPGVVEFDGNPISVQPIWIVRISRRSGRGVMVGQTISKSPGLRSRLSPFRIQCVQVGSSISAAVGRTDLRRGPGYFLAGGLYAGYFLALATSLNMGTFAYMSAPVYGTFVPKIQKQPFGRPLNAADLRRGMAPHRGAKSNLLMGSQRTTGRFSRSQPAMPGRRL